MSKKLKKLLKGCVILAPFLFILLEIFRNGFNEESITYIMRIYTDIISTSQLAPLFNLFLNILGFNQFSVVVFVVFLSLIFTDFIIILYDLLMFIPHFVGKMLDKLGKVGVKDE